MVARKSVKPAAAETANGLQNTDRPGGAIWLKDKRNHSTFQTSGVFASETARRHEQCDLGLLFRIQRNPCLDAPGPAIGGLVFVMRHWDELENYEFFSANLVSKSGTGWQSDRIYSFENAVAISAVLADFCQAEWVRE
jgi:hypothetical protein